MCPYSTSKALGHDRALPYDHVIETNTKTAHQHHSTTRAPAVSPQRTHAKHLVRFHAKNTERTRKTPQVPSHSGGEVEAIHQVPHQQDSTEQS